MYPGDQGKPGGRPPRRPPQQPYGPGAEAPPYGHDRDHDRDESPFAPREEGTGAMPAFGGEAQGPPAGQTAAWHDPPGGNAPMPDGEHGFHGDFHGDFHDGLQHGAPPAPGGEHAPPERRRGLPLIIGGAVAAGVLLIGGGLGLSSLLKDDEPRPEPEPTRAAPTQPRPTPSPTQPVLAPVKLQSRATDPVPLTLKEVFGKGRFKAGKFQYTRTAVNAKKSCAGAVGGAALEKSLKKGGCTQALRATYAISGNSLIGTVGVFNLKDEKSAKAAAKAAAGKDAFLQALPGKGVTRNNGKGEALGTSQARGHYVIMTWVQRPDGKKIPGKYHQAVQAFGTQMVKGSNLALALHYRETEGKPLQK